MTRDGRTYDYVIVGAGPAGCVLANRLSADGDDLEVLLEGLKLAREIVRAEPFDEYRGAEVLPGSDVRSDAELIEYVRDTAETLYHPVGTCKMGDDELADVDDRLRVRGLEGLRVADASVMPTITSGNTDAPTTMIAERAADFVRNETPSEPTGTVRSQSREAEFTYE